MNTNEKIGAVAEAVTDGENEMPGILYKYCDRRGIDIFESHRLKVTPFNEFNDPFEIRPRMRPDFSIEDARAAILEPEFLDIAFEKMVADGFSGSFEEFRAIINAHIDLLAAKNVENYPDDAAEFREQHSATMSLAFGLICLSAVRDDILMWSHYADGHSGFVVGFNTKSPFFAEGPPVHKVDYAHERALMGHYSDHREAGQRTEVISALIRRKSTHWRYEQEWRQLRALSECDREPNPRRPGRHLFFKAIEPAAICEIILGCRCEDTQLLKVISRPEFDHVKKARAAVHESNFELVISKM